LLKHATNRRAIDDSRLNSKANDAAGPLIHHHQHPKRAQETDIIKVGEAREVLSRYGIPGHPGSHSEGHSGQRCRRRQKYELLSEGIWQVSAVGTHSFAPLVNEKNASTYIHLGNVAVVSFLAPSNGR